MVIINTNSYLYSDDFRGKCGEPTGYGEAIFGKSRYGDRLFWNGVFQKHMTKKGMKLNRHRDNFPTNPQTVPQQAWRNLFRSAMLAWAELDTETKAEYNSMVYPPGQYGVNRFITEYIKLHR